MTTERRAQPMGCNDILQGTGEFDFEWLDAELAQLVDLDAPAWDGDPPDYEELGFIWTGDKWVDPELDLNNPGLRAIREDYRAETCPQGVCCQLPSWLTYTRCTGGCKGCGRCSQ